MKHLQEANQTYLQHLKDSISYSMKSAKATFYFFVHALYPDVFTCSGSDEVIELSDILRTKLNK